MQPAGSPLTGLGVPGVSAQAASWVPQAWANQQGPLLAQAGMTQQPLLSAADAEAESQRRTAQIQTLNWQVEAMQAELHKLRSNRSSQNEGQAATAVRAEQARQLLAAFQPDLEAAQEKLVRAVQVAHELNLWFLENADKMNIQDTNATPSAFLEQILRSCHARTDGLRGETARLEGLAKAMRLGAIPGSTLEGAAQQMATASSKRPTEYADVPGSRPGPTPASSRPGGAGVPGLWVRDPDQVRKDPEVDVT